MALDLNKALALPVDTLLTAVNTYLPGPQLGPLLVQWEGLCRSALPDEWEAWLDAFLKTHQSAHAKNLPLMNPYHVLLVVLGYLAMVVFGTLIAKFVLPKMELRAYSALHNFFLVLLSGYMMTEVIHQAVENKYSFWGNPSDETSKGWPMAKIIWLFYVSKIAEFNDTLIMILKHNFHQVSFLHVYHHVTIFAIWWLVTFIAPGGEAYYSAALNSFIHVVMYLYYLSSTLKIKWISFIKHYVTMMQMTQFFTMLLQASYDMYTGGGGYPQLTTQILFVYMLSLLALFYNFLLKDMQRKNQEKANAKANGKGKSKAE